MPNAAHKLPSPLVLGSVRPVQLPSKKRSPHIVVVDDDPVFARIIETLGARLGCRVSHCLTPDAAAEFPDIDVMVVDYDLGVTTGLQFGFAAEHLTPAPILFISHSQDVCRASEWPSSVVGFVSKAVGPRAILIAALQAFQASRREVRPEVIPPALLNGF